MRLPKLLTATEVANSIGASPSTVYEWAGLKKIPSIKINGLLRFKEAEILKWLEASSSGKK